MENKIKYNPKIHHRRSIRLKGYDYAQAGLYFITICCHEKACLFGKIGGAKNFSTNDSPINLPNNLSIDEPKMILNDAGIIANNCWMDIPKHFPNAALHEYIIMPNHIHGIIELSSKPVGVENFPIHNDDNRANNHSPLRSPSKTIGSIVRGFKIGVTKWMRQNTDVYDVWQRNYYEIIIRNELSYQTISNYIIDNPAKWKGDKFYK